MASSSINGSISFANWGPSSTDDDAWEGVPEPEMPEPKIPEPKIPEENTHRTLSKLSNFHQICYKACLDGNLQAIAQCERKMAEEMRFAIVDYKKSITNFPALNSEVNKINNDNVPAINQMWRNACGILSFTDRLIIQLAGLSEFENGRRAGHLFVSREIVDRILKNGVKDLVPFVSCKICEDTSFIVIMEILLRFCKERDSLLEVDAKWHDPKTGEENSGMNKILELVQRGVDREYFAIGLGYLMYDKSCNVISRLPEIVSKILEAGSEVTLIKASPQFIWLTPEHMSRWKDPSIKEDDQFPEVLGKIYQILDRLLEARAALTIDCTLKNLEYTLDFDVPYLINHIVRRLDRKEREDLPKLYLKAFGVKSETNFLLTFMLPQEIAKIENALLERLQASAPSQLFFNALKDYIIFLDDRGLGQKILGLNAPAKLLDEPAKLEEQDLIAVLKRVVVLQGILKEKINPKEILSIIHSYDSDIPVE